MNISVTLPPSLRQAIEQSRERLETELSSNPRLRWLILGGAFTLYIGVLLTLWNTVTDARIHLTLEHDRLARLEAQVAETQWPTRAESAQVLAANLERKLWPGDTPGLAEAGFERWIRQSLESEGVEVRQVQLTRSPVQEDRSEIARPALAQVQRIRAKVVAPLDEAALIRLLSVAAENPSWILVEQLIVRGGRNERFKLDLAVFYRPPGAGS